MFDDVGGRWTAVATTSGGATCVGISVEVWEVITLQPRPDGTLSGEYTSIDAQGCNRKRTVTFTRIGDVDVDSLPDPTGQAPRVVSPAEALHGRYHSARTFANGYKHEYDLGVRTDCLRSGERCMSLFHSPDAGIPLVFASGNWTENQEFDGSCPSGGTSHVKVSAEFPLPQPPQDPITLLVGHGHQDVSGSACTGGDFDDKVERTGD